MTDKVTVADLKAGDKILDDQGNVQEVFSVKPFVEVVIKGVGVFQCPPDMSINKEP